MDLDYLRPELSLLCTSDHAVVSYTGLTTNVDQQLTVE